MSEKPGNLSSFEHQECKALELGEGGYIHYKSSPQPLPNSSGLLPDGAMGAQIAPSLTYSVQRKGIARLFYGLP